MDGGSALRVPHPSRVGWSEQCRPGQPGTPLAQKAWRQVPRKLCLRGACAGRFCCLGLETNQEIFAMTGRASSPKGQREPVLAESRRRRAGCHSSRSSPLNVPVCDSRDN